MPDKLYGAILFYLSVVYVHFKTSPYLLQQFWRMLRRCLAVKLQKCFVDNKTTKHFLLNLSCQPLSS